MVDWPHAPVHRLFDAGAYIVTAGTYQKVPYFDTPARLDLVQNFLLDIAPSMGWQLQAWAILSNHYHFVALSPENPDTLKKLVSKLHTLSAREINRQDRSPGRKVWFQYWDTYLRDEDSYLSRLKYVHLNPLHHGVVATAREYLWCSAKWFESNATENLRKSVMRMKIDQIEVEDSF